MPEFISFIIEIILPVAAAIAFISRISKVKHNEERIMALIGVLIAKDILVAQDLISLGLLNPTPDLLDSLSDMMQGMGR